MRRFLPESVAIAGVAGMFAVPAGCQSKPAPPTTDVSLVDAARANRADLAVKTQALPDAASDARPMSNATSTTILSADAGAGACKLLRPAVMQTAGGPGAVRFVRAGAAEIAELVFNDEGRPVFSDAPFKPDAGVRDVPMPPKTVLPGCAAAGGVVYCPDPSGAIHRTRGSGEDDVVVAKSRAGTPVSAAVIGDGHVVVAYIDEVTTSEGQVREAKMLLDDAAPMRLSEDGSGATSVELAARGDAVVALIVDARVAMTPAHARVVKVRGGNLELGRDAVVFVGGAAERHTSGSLAIDKEGSLFALLAVSDSAESFGMAVIRISDPPKEYEPVAWSTYPNGIDPASIAATRGVTPIRVARARPTGTSEDASRVLEVGNLGPSGEFQPKCILAEAAYIKDIALDVDRQGAMWIFWRDTRGSHFERRALP